LAITHKFRPIVGIEPAPPAGVVGLPIRKSAAEKTARGEENQTAPIEGKQIR
jgi:hypothetical protein